MEQDKEVVLARNDDYWGEKPHIERVRLAVIPDTTTRALELRKGSADAAINAFTGDLYIALKKDRDIRVLSAPGSIYAYLAMNLRDPILKDVRVRQALNHAVNRREIIHYLLRDYARPAYSLLPPSHWAYLAPDQDDEHPYDPQKARQILDAAGYKPDAKGVRFHLTMKTSTEESTRLLAAVLQQQLRDVGIALDIRSFEFATFYADVQKGAFQLYSLRWIGGNEDPDIFEAVFHSASVPPKRFNRGYYSNPRMDQLIDEGRRETDQNKRRAIYAEVQRILERDLPYINLWYFDNVLVTSERVHNVALSQAGDFDFLVKAELTR
jgi:peptide/nickel transport system substrate-binding protein